MVLIGPGAGDHLQGIKRGVIELADALVITKADGDSAALAANTRQEFAHALELLHADRDGWQPHVLTCSSLEDQGIAEAWVTVTEHRQFLLTGNRLSERRRQQRLRWFHEAVDAMLRERFLSDPAMAARLETLAAQVLHGELAPTAAAKAALRQQTAIVEPPEPWA
jgi:LAO/AO transport system kinase